MNGKRHSKMRLGSHSDYVNGDDNAADISVDNKFVVESGIPSVAAAPGNGTAVSVATTEHV